MNIDKSTAEEFFAKGFSLDCAGKIEEALHFYNKAIEIDPEMEKAYSSRANILFSLKEYEKALKDYNTLSLLASEDSFAKERAICYENLGELEQSLFSYLELFIRDIDKFSFEKICSIVAQNPELRTKIDISEIETLISKYKSEERAVRLSEVVSDYYLEQKSYFLDLAISLLPENSDLMYNFYLKKADYEVFLYRICFDNNFREEIKKTNGISEEKLVELYRFNPENVSVSNLVYAVQRLNEATRYAKNLGEVNDIDKKISDIMLLINYQL